MILHQNIYLIGGWDGPYVTIKGHVLRVYRPLAACDATRVRVTALQDGHSWEKSRGELARIVSAWILRV